MRYPSEFLITALLASLLLGACATMDRSVPGSLPTTDQSSTAPVAVPEAPRQTGPDVAGDEPEYAPAAPTLYRGTGEVFRQPPQRPPLSLIGDAVSLNFEEAPLTEIVHAVMGDMLELDYVIEHPLEGKVTLRTRSPVPRDELLSILESLLKANNALMVRDREGRFFISTAQNMRRLQPGLAGSASSAVGYSTVVIPLQYISAADMAEILAPVAEEESFVRVDNLRNVLMLAGTRAQLQGWQEIINTFDVDLMKGMSVGIFPIENMPIEEVESALGTMMGKGGGEGGEEGQIAGIGSMVRIIPVERLSSIIVVTPRAHYLERVGTWIERLDQEPDAFFERRLHVYAVQNTHASHLADMLSIVFAGGQGGASGGAGTGVAPGFTPERVSDAGESPSTPTRSREPQRRNFNFGDIRVVADEENNALLIYATGQEFRKMRPALEQLDVAATQVIIEASIVEVTLTDELRYGLEWSFNGDIGGDYTGVGQLVGGNNIAPQVPGFSYSVINSSGQIKAVLNALASDNLLNVISSPSVMVLDNQTATIQVGDQVPVETGTTLTEVGTTTTIQYRDTGVKLSVTPSVNAGGMVTMDVEQSVTDVGPVDEATGQRSFLERNITSRVAVRAAESVVLGGLIRENKSSGSSGIPVLHNLPLIGPLFGTKTDQGTRTELLVVITPRVIFSDADLREVSRQMRRQMRGLDLIDVSDSSSFLGRGPEAGGTGDPVPQGAEQGLIDEDGGQ